MKKTIITILVTSSMFILYSNKSASFSADIPAPAYPIEKSEDTQLVVEFQHKYYAFEYRQPLKISVIDQAASKYITPEDSFVSLVSAIINDNSEWYLKAWDTESQLLKSGKLQTEFTSIREKLLLGDIILTNRIERKNIVILHYAIVKFETIISNGYFMFKSFNGDWKATSVLPDDPVLKNYDDLTKMDRIQIIHN